MADRLESGSRLLVNQTLHSADGRFTLVLQSDGNLVEYAPGPQALWATGTDGSSTYCAVMQEDGNFVLYEPDGHAVWSSGTEGNWGAILVLQNDSNLVIYDHESWFDNPARALWATNTYAPPTPTPSFPPWSARLHARQFLRVGESLTSFDRRFTLVLQADGNLVLYGPGGSVLWASGTDGQPVLQAVMQEDGNFVVYAPDGTPTWAAGTDGNPDSQLVLESSGQVVIYNTRGAAIWAQP